MRETGKWTIAGIMIYMAAMGAEALYGWSNSMGMDLMILAALILVVVTLLLDRISACKKQ